MYQVLDNDKPADSTGFTILEGKGWDTSKFDTLEKAIEYANKWLGEYGRLPQDLTLNRPFYYGPFEDYLVIKEIR